MSKISYIKNASQTEAWLAVYYLYNLVNNLNKIPSNCDSIQELFLSLVNRFKLNNHLSNILSKKLSELVKQKKLTPMNLPPNRKAPFDKIHNITTNYQEDYEIYSNCGDWSTSTDLEINLCRFLFVEKRNKLINLIKETFFTNISNNSKYPVEIKNALNDFSEIQIIKDSFNLSKKESTVLMLSYLTHKTFELSYFSRNIQSELDSHYESKKSTEEFYKRCLNFSDKEISEILNKRQPLIAYNIFSKKLEIEEDMVDAIRQNNLGVFYLDLIKKNNCKNSFKKESFSVSARDTNILIKLLQSDNPCNILLYGEPGSGKTEFSKTIAKETGLTSYIYKNEIETKSEYMDRLFSYLTISKNDSVLIIDEAENILKAIESDYFNTGKTKGLINKMLDNSKNKVIWIVNSLSYIPQSTLRRFNYSLEFKEMPKETLKAIVEKRIHKINISTNAKKKIIELFDNYKITGASIDNVIKGIEAFKDSDEDELLLNVENILKVNSKLLFGKKRMRDTVQDSYDLSVLNTSMPVEDICDMVENAINQYKNSGEKKGIRLLFYGLSGTGKTELARYISKVLNKKILLQRTSNIISPFVGMTEQNIAMAFDEADRNDSILLFDEADSFFADRGMAQHSWDRTMVNEFLTQMEEFSGILICTTNLRNIMDPAMQRRFHILTEFKPLTKNGIESLLDKFFPDKNFSDFEIEKLSSYETVTPGDFGSLKGRIDFMSPEKVTDTYIVNELITIQKEKCNNVSHSIGFAC